MILQETASSRRQIGEVGMANNAISEVHDNLAIAAGAASGIGPISEIHGIPRPGVGGPCQLGLKGPSRSNGRHPHLRVASS
jgi:hypothetical protein